MQETKEPEAKASAEELVLAYRKIRDAKKEKEDELKQEIRALDDQLNMLEAAILEICNEHNVDGLKTPAGTVSRSVRTRYWTSDWEAMYKFIKEHDVPFLLEKRVHNANMQQFLEDNPDMHPEGLNVDTRYTITVRKPTGA